MFYESLPLLVIFYSLLISLLLVSFWISSPLSLAISFSSCFRVFVVRPHCFFVSPSCGWYYSRISLLFPLRIVSGSVGQILPHLASAFFESIFGATGFLLLAVLGTAILGTAIFFFSLSLFHSLVVSSLSSKRGILANWGFLLSSFSLSYACMY